MKKLLCAVLMLCMLVNVLGIAGMAETEPAAEEEIELFFESDVEDEEEPEEEPEEEIPAAEETAVPEISIETVEDGVRLSVDAEGTVLWQMQEGTDVSAAVEEDWVNVAEGASIVVAPETDTLYRALIEGETLLDTAPVAVAAVSAASLAKANETPVLPDVPEEPAPQYELSGAYFLAAGKSMTIAVTLNGKTVKASTLDWESDNKDIATVSAGKVTTAKTVEEPKSVTITATSKTDKNIKGMFDFFVTVPTTKVTVTAADNKTVLDKGETVQLSAAVKPEPQACPFVTWKSSNVKIATVSGSGLVTPKKVGKVTITATAIDGTKKSGSIVLSVVNTVKGLELTGPNEIGVGKSVTLKPIITPNDATNKKVTWESDSKDITVSKTGVVKASAKAAVGTTATITAKSVENPAFIAAWKLTVKPAVTAVKIGNVDTVIDCVEGNTLMLSATCKPAEASQHVTWKSSNEKIAKVSAAGEVTPMKVGKVTITATAADGSKKSAKIVLNVVKKIKGLSIEGLDAVAFGKSIKLTAVCDPIDATDKKVVWTTSNKYIATVSTAGVVKANAKLKRKTQVTIKATSVENNTVFATKTIEVGPLVKSVAIDECLTTIAVGETLNLSATCTPEEAGQGVTWKTGNAKIATVDAKTGVVTAVKVGKVTITATAVDGSKKSAKVVLNVVSATNVKTVTIEGNDIMTGGADIRLTAIVTPENATNKNVIWSSSDEEVATVDENGLVLAKDVAVTTTVIITATSAENENIKGTHEMTVVAARAVPFMQVGNTVTYGYYEQDNNLENGKEAIEWIVLKHDAENNRSLLISRYGLDAVVFDSGNFPTWANSHIRAWLNNDFMNAAFTTEEKAGIVTTKISTPDNNGNSSGADTQDKVWLLSREEAEEWFDCDEARGTSATPYAKAHGARAAWWLRSHDPHYDIFVVSFDGGIQRSDPTIENMVVRPAMWLDLSKAPLNPQTDE